MPWLRAPLRPVSTMTVTSTVLCPDPYNKTSTELVLYLDVTALGGTSTTLTPSIQVLEPMSQTFINLHPALPAISSTGTYLIQFAPALPTYIDAYPATVGTMVPSAFLFNWAWGDRVHPRSRSGRQWTSTDSRGNS